jgi:hypothetical protein
LSGVVRDIEVIADPTAAVAALDPVRTRPLAEPHEPASAATLAVRVGLTWQTVNYHDEAPDGRWQRLMVTVHPLPSDAAA